ncbi:hypothetical protein BV22DRAFT_1038465 [Leucogyrophana mollusca]|uniref:Uncharacterized protein n=1 Tax=Leucogyrophana mollusca TaxID=85980 RepID=A0ACB8B7Y6_9AGAM|nr:hypothetical protein BV22DRAFT_1038465 [Leucogyrophana mollusca]
MLQFGTLYACIKVDGILPTAYGIETIAEEKKVTCWIPSEVGKTFSIVWQDTYEFRNYHQAGYVTIDGVPICGTTLPPLKIGEPLSYANCTSELTHLRTSDTSGRLLTFSNLQLTDDDTYIRSTLMGLGEIVLSIWRAEVICEVPLRPSQAMLNQVVHERTKKAYSHCVGFGNEVALPLIQGLDLRRVGTMPLATFVFRYRPLDRLIADGIAPSPIKREVAGDFEGRDRKPDNKTAQELQALKEHVKKLEKEIVHYRQSSSKRIKSEDCGEIVDLTN